MSTRRTVPNAMGVSAAEAVQNVQDVNMKSIS